MTFAYRVAQQIAADLDGRPEAWECDGYNLTRKGDSALSIWVANGIWGMSITASESGARIGGVVLFGWLTPWRVRLWLAIRRWQHQRVRAAFA